MQLKPDLHSPDSIRSNSVAYSTLIQDFDQLTEEEQVAFLSEAIKKLGLPKILYLTADLVSEFGPGLKY